MTEATIATWFKKPGDRVEMDEMLCELETDKVTVEVPSPAAGTLSEIVAAEGETVGPDALLAQITEGGAAAPAKEQAPAADAADQKQAAKPAETTPEGQGKMSGKNIDVMVPSLGESVTEATVATWFKKPGDQVAADEMLCELETDKVSVEVPAPAAGVLAEILAEEGATVDAKARLAIITEGATGSCSAPKAEAPSGEGAAYNATKTAQDTVLENAGPEEMKPREDIEDAPSAKKAMAEAGVSRDQVQGSGRDGRVMKEDVAKAGPAPSPPHPAHGAARARPAPTMPAAKSGSR